MNDWSILYDTNDGWETTAEVGKFPAGKSPFGVLDMAGNVWEWTMDLYGPYPPASPDPLVDPKGPKVPSEKDHRVVRGGAWGRGEASWFRTVIRTDRGMSDRDECMGFRCASSQEPVGGPDPFQRTNVTR